jgi:hypothetical protein
MGETVSICVDCALVRFCYGNTPYAQREHCGLFIPNREDRPDDFFKLTKNSPEKLEGHRENNL